MTDTPTGRAAVLADARQYAREHDCCPFCGADIDARDGAVCGATFAHPEACTDAN